ncbi:MAG: ATP-dependent sacrificial sulfur transferase LarE [Desulfobacterales bacterium]|nr:ATP-dependent sacrificial sulfur transferase LarE [Desulfobacteraceae bacterium]MBT4364985.1 ATP-dependent sacrificial sulfur transferase LarE [Desulfobacteraceae bacterium]MBT7697558.1 ATP-dependent sacrificial sulfur transferase LarE [Desulfobacterales bacterium]
MSESKYKKLKEVISGLKQVAVAYSGGVDSTFLLKVASDVLGENVLAITARSATLPGNELQDAESIAKTFNVKHLIIDSDELENPDFTKNPPDKCYICKKIRFSGLIKIAKENGFTHVIDGGNADDHKDYRPGSKAARELGVRSPLSESGLTKDDIRKLSKKLKLPTWDKPANACLATRIPYNIPITIEKLMQVNDGEEYLRGLGLSPQLRVRHYGDSARIELDPEDIPGITEASTRKKVVNYFKTLGFKFVTIDLEGYIMGSLNKTIRT